ncbi:tRNA selenocysteine 1-associated protein 1 isoform X2 [Hetaerina americana]|uniref:tRNA selenocysteine 1-associated protein 1 isoform X2 n=1 Tax=Hetaerina americana TaxID=62018 RepID=UPI003A7F1A15
MAATGAIHCQLWMGGLESYMNETFVKTAFQKLGEDPQSVKIMRNKYSGEPAGYCFVHFITDEAALNAMHKLNGKVIPNSNPPVRFKLNHASTTGRPPQDREFSLWVGDLSSDVDDYTLYRTFAAKYPSIRTAKVILDTSGFSKGYGFIRFAQEDEQKRCLTEMNGHTGLGTKAIKISNAVPKPHRYHSPSMSAHIPENCSAGTTTHAATTPTGSTTPATPTGTAAVGSTATATPASTDYSQPQQQYYDPYWQNYGAWQGYHQGYYDPNVYGQGAMTAGTSVANGAADGSAHAPPTAMDYGQHPQQHMVDPAPPVVSNEEALAREEDDMELVEHDVPVDVDKLNKELCDRDYLLWDAIESSKWLPVECLEC